MSYARFGAQGSDVYLFPCKDGLECCACPLARGDRRDAIIHFRTRSLASFEAHLAEHRTAGHHVPDDVESDIRTDLDWLERDGIVVDDRPAACPRCSRPLTRRMLRGRPADWECTVCCSAWPERPDRAS